MFQILEQMAIFGKLVSVLKYMQVPNSMKPGVQSKEEKWNLAQLVHTLL